MVNPRLLVGMIFYLLLIAIVLVFIEMFNRWGFISIILMVMIGGVYFLLFKDRKKGIKQLEELTTKRTRGKER